jgi:hypothetical protein
MSHGGTPLQSPAVRRFSQVYVEIPPSPLHRPRTLSGSQGFQHVSTLSANRKENAPLRPSNMFRTQMQSTSASPSRKRKLSESDANMAIAAISSSDMKKPKLAAEANKPKASKPSKDGGLIPNAQLSNACEEFPNGFFYCHQCSKKRDFACELSYIRNFFASFLIELFVIVVGIHCTMKDAHNHRCKVKFCASCLKNRYGERAGELKATVKAQDNTVHVQDESYVWK